MDLNSQFDFRSALTEALADQRILVTGASGLIGFNLTKELHSFGKKGINFKSLTITGRTFPPWLNSWRSEEIIFLPGDLLSEHKILGRQEFDIIFHCAGSAEPNIFLKNPWSTMRMNTSITMSLIEHLSQNGVLVYMSTSEIYTGIKSSPYIENMSGISTPDHARSIYIEAKRSGEAIVNQLPKISQMTGINCRVSLAYGPGFRKNDTRVVFTFIRAAIETGQIIIHGNGSAIRRYVYVDDAIEQILGTLAINKSDTYNVSGIGASSILEIAEIIAGLTGAQLSSKPNENVTIGAPDAVIVDSSKINSLIGKHDFISLSQGLKAVIQWYRANH